jgi:DNA-binding Xre family transcriptional regulator
MDKLMDLIKDVKLPKSKDKATNELIEALDAKAREQGFSGAMEHMMQDPEMRGIMIRMIGAELKAQKEINDQLKALGENIRNWRLKKGLSDKEMAQRVGITVRYYRKIENGSSPRITYKLLMKIAEALGIKISNIVVFGKR